MILPCVANKQRQNFCIFLKIFSKVISFSIFFNKLQPSSLYCLRDILIEKTFAAKKAKWIIFNVALEMKWITIKKSILVKMIKKVIYYVTSI